jgi:SAM-dependent MidA family methyltransferase
MKNLPSPHKDKTDLSSKLKAIIAEKINKAGPISFSDYMNDCLYYPSLGYYKNGLTIFGKQGDFVTAPEISSLFGYCLANQCADILSRLSTEKVILEFGSGSGKLASDILSQLNKLKCLPSQYLILEPSAVLQQRQKKYLMETHPDYFHNIQWLSSLPKEKITGVIIANEVLDAMPVNIFEYNHDFYETHVDLKDNEFIFTSAPMANTLLREALSKKQVIFPSPYRSEINLHINGWVKSLSLCLKKGAALLIDYGYPEKEYYHHDRNQGTLMCHYCQRSHSDPLILPGIQDITAHVDFTAIAHAAVNNKLCISGYCHQEAFLISCGIMEYATNKDPELQYKRAQEIKYLTLQSEMGELFKVIAVSKNYDHELIGFKLQNSIEKL